MHNINNLILQFSTRNLGKIWRKSTDFSFQKDIFVSCEKQNSVSEGKQRLYLSAEKLYPVPISSCFLGGRGCMRGIYRDNTNL